MNTNVKVGLKGKYIFKDSDGNVIRVVDNLITDNGFKRFCGGTQHFCYNFWMNMRFLFLGEQTATELPTDYDLASYHIPNDPYTEGAHFTPAKAFTSPPTFFMKHLSVDPDDPGGSVPWHSEAYNPANWDDSLWNNADDGIYYWPPKMVAEGGSYDPLQSTAGSKFPNLVGTTYLKDPITGDIIIRFANTWNLKFNAATTIGEIGVGPAPKNSNDDVTKKCGGTQPYNSGGIASPYSPTTGAPTDINRIDHQNDAKSALFSRATLNPQAFFNATDETTVTYICDIVICKGLAMATDLPFDLAPGSSPSDAFPPSKTSMRQIPFFKLQGNAKTTNFGNKWMVTTTPPFKSPFDVREGVGIPLFDNVHTSSPGIWALDTFKYTIPVFNTIQPTLTADHQEYNVSGFGAKAVPNPVNTTYEKHFVSTSPNNTPTYVKRYYPVGGIVTTPVVGTGLPGSENTYVTKFNFVIPSNHWIVGGTGGGEEMNSFTLWRPINRNHIVQSPLRVQTGFHTFLNGLYTPSPNKFIKLSYQIIWNRL